MAVRFLYDNLYADATLTASSSATALPVAATQNPDRSYLWRSTETTGDVTIDIDLGSTGVVSAVALANPKVLGAGGTIELYQRGNSTTLTTGTLVATLPTANTDRRTAVQFFTSQAYRNWQLKFTNTGGADYAELGYAFLGQYYEPGRNIAWPTVSVDEIDPSVVRRSVDRQRAVVTRTRYTVGRFDWQYLASTERDAVRALWGALGVESPAFAVLSTGLAWTAWMLYLEPGFSQAFSAKPDTYDVGFGWEECT